MGFLQAQGYIGSTDDPNRNAGNSAVVRAVLGAALYPQFGQIIETKQKHCKLVTPKQEKVLAFFLLSAAENDKTTKILFWHQSCIKKIWSCTTSTLNSRSDCKCNWMGGWEIWGCQNHVPCSGCKKPTSKTELGTRIPSIEGMGVLTEAGSD